MKTHPNFSKPIVLVAATCLFVVGQAFCQDSGGASSQPEGIVSPYNGLTLEPIEGNSGFTFFMTGHSFGSSPTAKKTTDPSPLLAAQIDRINNSQAKFFMGLGDLYWRQDGDRAKISNLRSPEK